MEAFDLVRGDICSDISFTYRCDDHQFYSWVDHVICSSSTISNILSIDSVDNFSDHLTWYGPWKGWANLWPLVDLAGGMYTKTWSPTISFTELDERSRCLFCWFCALQILFRGNSTHSTFWSSLQICSRQHWQSIGLADEREQLLLEDANHAHWAGRREILLWNAVNWSCRQTECRVIECPNHDLPAPQSWPAY